MKEGFTLVELSIVLVIIGLLIGGILVAQSLVDSAKINQTARQIQQYDIAVSNFQERFNQLPGDSSLITPPGNNDGDIAFADSTGETSCGLATCRESYSFWKHLSDTNMINESYDNDFSTGFVVEGNSPEFYESYLSTSYSISDNDVTGSRGWRYESDRVLSGNIVLSIENKIDDGDASTGFVRSEEPGSLTACNIDDINACVIYITIMSTIGTPLNN